VTAATYPLIDAQVADFMRRVRSSAMVGRLLGFHAEKPVTPETVAENVANVAWMLEELALAEAERLHAERRKVPVEQLDPVFPDSPTPFVEHLQEARGIPPAVKSNAFASLLFRAILERSKHPSGVARAPVKDPEGRPRPVKTGGRTLSPKRIVALAVDRLQPQCRKFERDQIGATLCEEVLGIPTSPAQIAELLKGGSTRPPGSRRRPSTRH
jgi:hypothetical protein